MIVDTNVLLRLLSREASIQAPSARRRVEAAREAGDRMTVLAATVLEVAFVLESAAAGYGWNRDSVARAVETVVDEPAFAVEHGEALQRAAATYRERAIDLHDCYLHAVAGASGTRVLSFDADLRRLGTGEEP